FREAYFNPTFSKYAGQVCGGVQVYVTDRDAFDPIHTAVAMLIEAHKLQPADMDFWRPGTPGRMWIDLLTGNTWTHDAIEDGLSADEVVAGWQDELSEFRATRDKHLIYHKMRRGGQVD